MSFTGNWKRKATFVFHRFGRDPNAPKP
jgi:hypothetical protein